jgi:hypothetical protein
MDDLLSSIRNDLLKICTQVNFIREVEPNDSTCKIISKKSPTEKNENKDNPLSATIEIDDEKLTSKHDVGKTNKVEVVENQVLIRIKKKRKEVPSEDRCTKLLVKNGIETRCSFRKIEKKDFCKKHLK